MRKQLVSCIAAVVLLLTTAGPALALGGKVDSPGVAFAAGYPAQAQKKVNAALTREDAQFLDGFFINSWTTLRYGGKTPALNMFLEDLAKCPGVTVHVSFKKLNDDCAWRVGHDAHRNRFQVEVNLNSAQVEMESLYLPEFASKD